MRTISLFFLIAAWPAAVFSAGDEWLTQYERSGYAETSRYDETVAFCRMLADASSYAEYRAFGTSAEGRELPLLWIDKSQRRDTPLFFIVAGIHAGEIDGKDAGLTLLRDVLIFNKHRGLLDSIRIAFVPIFNVDGHERWSKYSRSNQIGPKEMGWRTTAQNLNLNRDWLKADTPEMQAMLRLINELKPDFLADIHVTDGADWQYVITYALGVHENELEPLHYYNAERFLPSVKTKLHDAGLEFTTYGSFRKPNDVQSGMELETAEPRFSSGYGTVINRPFMLIETHSLKDYRTRVTATYEFLKSAIETLKEQAPELQAANRAADSVSSSLAGKSYALSWNLAKDSTMIEFLGVDYEFVSSLISGDKVVRWGTTPKTYRIPVFDRHEPGDTLVAPHAYVIPPQWYALIQDVLTAQGLTVMSLTKATQVAVESCRFSNVSFATRPYEGRYRVDFTATSFADTLALPTGSIILPLDQPRAQIAIHLLEPRGPDSFVRWGFFSQIFEQKEYMEAYVADTLAAHMLAESPVLASEFNARLSSDSVFAASPEARYQFFYERSPYWDSRKDVYPIGRITSKAEYDRIKFITQSISKE